MSDEQQNQQQNPHMPDMSRPGQCPYCGVEIPAPFPIVIGIQDTPTTIIVVFKCPSHACNRILAIQLAHVSILGAAISLEDMGDLAALEGRGGDGQLMTGDKLRQLLADMRKKKA